MPGGGSDGILGVVSSQHCSEALAESSQGGSGDVQDLWRCDTKGHG